MNSVSKLCIYYNLLLHFSFVTQCLSQNQPPKLTVIFVVDQCPYHMITKLLPFMNYGIKQMVNKGTSFTNAHHPNFKPGTFTGHTNLNTGADACDHGGIGNYWYNNEGEKIICDGGDPINDAVFSPNGMYDYGKSPQHIMVDGISDQFMMSSSPLSPRHVVSVSGKSRSAIATANNAQAFWFDNQSGQLTSSKAYCDKLSDWVERFNASHAIKSPGTITWDQCYDEASGAYSFDYIDDYRFSRRTPFVGKTLPIGPEADPEKPYINFELSPSLNRFIMDAALTCIQEHVSPDKPDQLLLWVCLSSLDKVGHRFGPWSREYADMLCHVDKDIGFCMQEAQEIIKPSDCLFILTSDHGIPPFIAHLREKGLKNIGHLIESKELIKEINLFIEEQYGIPDLIYAAINHQLYVNLKKFYSLSLLEQKNAIKDIQSFVETMPGIKKVWTPQALLKQSFHVNSPEFYFQKQYYPGRSGQLLLQMHPFSLVSGHINGTSHSTPHTHNTHVPLILYRPGVTQPKKVHSRVVTLQLANTLAEILQVPQPSSSYVDVLPYALDK